MGKLAALNRKFQLPWLCFGDFNEILSREEKLGGALRSQRQMDGFKEVVNVCGFKDLGYNSPDFTWCNNCVYLRLDRAFATNDWINMFSGTRVLHLIDSTFDHCTLLIANTIAVQPPRKRRFHFEETWTKIATNDWINMFSGTRVLHLVDSTFDHCALLIADTIVVQPPRKRRFHSKEMWTKKEECKEIVKNAKGSLYQCTPEGIATSLKNCAVDLVRWNKLVFVHVPKQIQSKRKALNALILQDRDGIMGKEINRLRREINDLLDCEETLWHQRSRVLWYGQRDRNTKFFQSKAF